MEKVEQYIKEHTRSDSNELCSIESRIGKDFVSYREWLPLEQARNVAKIAREETIKEVCEWLDNHTMLSEKWYIEDLKKHLEDKL